MSLLELCDNNKTDKNTTHSYLELYEKLLNNKKYTAKNVLEVGVKEGGSIKLWHDYFENAIVYGIDIIPVKDMWDEITNKNRIKLGIFDAYDDYYFNKYFLNKINFDFVLDDGPHTLESMIKFIKLYLNLLTDDGILIIEDVQSIDWIEFLTNEVPEELKQFIEVYDLRNIKNRYDDIVFVVNKCNK
jgi:hypothetical protein